MIVQPTTEQLVEMQRLEKEQALIDDARVKEDRNHELRLLSKKVQIDGKWATRRNFVNALLSLPLKVILVASMTLLVLFKRPVPQIFEDTLAK